jgi:hypothetical protein
MRIVKCQKEHISQAKEKDPESVALEKERELKLVVEY